MMFRMISGVLVTCLICAATFAEEPSGSVIRPKKVDAEVKGCQVSEPGTYQAVAGSLIELEYSFPVTPATVPKVVDRDWDKGAIYGSVLGIRHLIVPRLVGTGTYVFYFEAKHAGSGTAMVVVDKTTYTYVFEVAEARR